MTRKGFQPEPHPEWCGDVSDEQGRAVVRLLQAADIIIRLKADGEADADMENVQTHVLREVAQVAAIAGVEQARGFLRGMQYFDTSRSVDTAKIVDSILG